MDFEDTPEEAEFRSEVRKWLAEQAVEYDLSNHCELSVDQQLALGRAFQARPIKILIYYSIIMKLAKMVDRYVMNVTNVFMLTPCDLGVQSLRLKSKKTKKKSNKLIWAVSSLSESSMLSRFEVS